MLRRKAQRRVQRIAPICHGLAGQAQHQIQVEPLGARRPRDADRLAHAVHIVDAIQPPQQRGLRGLHAQRYAVDPAGGQRIGKGLRQRAGIAFHRPFGVRGDIKVRPQRPQQAV